MSIRPLASGNGDFAVLYRSVDARILGREQCISDIMSDTIFGLDELTILNWQWIDNIELTMNWKLVDNKWNLYQFYSYRIIVYTASFFYIA